MKRPLSLLLLLLAALRAEAAPAPPREAALRMTQPGALRAHVRFLADDLLEGREATTRGHEIAALYVAAQFEAYGLEPAGLGGTYFQKVPLRHAQLVPEGSSLSLIASGRPREVQPGQDYLLMPDPHRPESEVRGPVVYVGYGVRAPERGHDDYAGIDVRGKVVALLMGAPAGFPNDERAYYSSRQEKAQAAAALGATGLLYILPPEEEKRFPFPRIAAQLQGGSMAWLDGQQRPVGLPETLRGRAVLSRAGAEALFAGAPHSLDDAFKAAAAGSVASFPLAVEALIRTASRHRTAESPNVLGVLRGSDPALSAEHVVLSAHVDHLGIGPAVAGDSIYNGAFDNASGTAGILEVARALSSLARPPRRSILFAALTAEEKGLLGAEYFVANPTIPLRSVVANLNMDMLLTLYPARDVVAFGAEHSSLGALAKQVAERLGLELAPDPFPQEVVFVRSDHYPFVRQGIPALMLSPGLTSADPTKDGGALFRQWIGTVYHSPRDDFSQAIDFEAAARIADAYFFIAHRVAEIPTRPTWNAGDFFGDRFGR